MGSPLTEVFLNTFSEIEEPYLAKLCQTVRASGIEVVSVHPFSSMLDGFFFASHYERRLQDGMDLYKRYFELCARLGAGKVVFHGDHAQQAHPFPAEQYAEHFRELAALGRRYGVTLCHENVYYCRLGSPAAVRQMRPLLGEAAAFTLDLKQVLRFGATADEMLDAMGEDVCHVHISDNAPGRDCIPPGTGSFDFTAFIQKLQALGYRGDLIIELYQEGYGSGEDLARAMQYISALL